MTHRQPTRHDIGHEVEVRSRDTDQWRKGILRSIEFNGGDDQTFWTGSNASGHWSFDWECRVPYTTADPIAELSEWADEAARCGADEVASILLKAVAAINEGQDIFGKCPLGIHFEAPYLQQDFAAWREYMLRANQPEPLT